MLGAGPLHRGHRASQVLQQGSRIGAKCPLHEPRAKLCADHWARSSTEMVVRSPGHQLLNLVPITTMTIPPRGFPSGTPAHSTGLFVRRAAALGDILLCDPLRSVQRTS